MQRLTVFKEIVKESEEKYLKFTQKRLNFIEDNFLKFLDKGNLTCEVFDSKGNLYAKSDTVKERKLLSNNVDEGFHYQVQMLLTTSSIIEGRENLAGPWRVVLNTECDGETINITDYEDTDERGITDRWKVTFDYSYNRSEKDQ